MEVKRLMLMGKLFRILIYRLSVVEFDIFKNFLLNGNKYGIGYIW